MLKSNKDKLDKIGKVKRVNVGFVKLTFKTLFCTKTVQNIVLYNNYSFTNYSTI